MAADQNDDLCCAKACAMLLVSGDNIDEDEFTRLFGVIPTEVARAGECTGWRLSSESHVQSTSLERHIHWILDQIVGKSEIINHLKLNRNCQVDLGCWWKGRPELDERGPFLSQETLQRIANFHLNLIFYFMR
jgi:Domain of unknown function (DUF4279)